MAAVEVRDDRSISALMGYVDGASQQRGTYQLLDDENSTLPLRPEQVTVRDARHAEHPATFEREGFTLASVPVRIADYGDDDEIVRRYLPVLADAIRQATGAAYVWMSPGAVIRVTEPAARTANGRPDAARFLHLDYSSWSAAEYLRVALGYDPQIAARHPRIFAVNTWRSISPPPQDVPLAVCDKRTSSLDDLVTADANYARPTGGSRSEISLARRNPAHRWSYYSDMQPDELLMFKGWDLSPQPTPSVLHGAFADPGCPADAPARTSIEARGFAVFAD